MSELKMEKNNNEQFPVEEFSEADEHINEAKAAIAEIDEFIKEAEDELIETESEILDIQEAQATEGGYDSYIKSLERHREEVKKIIAGWEKLSVEFEDIILRAKELDGKYFEILKKFKPDTVN